MFNKKIPHAIHCLFLHSHVNMHSQSLSPPVFSSLQVTPLSLTLTLSLSLSHSLTLSLSLSTYVFRHVVIPEPIVLRIAPLVLKQTNAASLTLPCFPQNLTEGVDQGPLPLKFIRFQGTDIL